MVGRPAGRVRDLRLRRHLHAAQLATPRADGKARGRRPAPRRLLQLRRLLGRRLLRQGAERRAADARRPRRRRRLRPHRAVRPRRRRDGQRRHRQLRYSISDRPTTRARPSPTSASRWSSDAGERRARLPFPHPAAARYGSRPWRSRTSRPASPPPSPAPAARPARSRWSPSPRCSRADRVRAVLDAGQRVFGENRVQEAEERWPPFREAFPGRRAAPRRPAADQQARPRARRSSTAIHSLDRDSLARKLADGRAGPRRLPDALRPGQHRPRAAEGRRRSRRASTPSSPPAAALRPAGLRPDGDPARSTTTRPRTSRCCATWPPATASPASRWA